MSLLFTPLCFAFFAALLLLCCTQVTLVAAVVTTDFTTAEQTATLAFLQAFVTVNPGLATLWSGSDFCTWTYVRCGPGQYTPSLLFQGSTSSTERLVLPELDASVDGSQVIFLSFSASGTYSTPFVKGTLPGSWSRLARVNLISLNNNALTGTLPASWSALSSLRGFDVVSNQLSGTLPASWGALSLLYTLYASSNAFTGSIPNEWVGMTTLSLVSMGQNNFCGCLPAAWASSSAIRSGFDAAVTASDCSTANACPAPTTTCSVPGCVTCADGSSTICAVCAKGETMGVANATCNVSGNGAGVPLPAGLMAAVVFLTSVAVLY